ncbi:histidine--tRNA ligase [Patescibacteria group bacterium]|nr:histidine--tRNA ligase [Candidatus Falkowbacteria bacterium]MBU3905674.1 histidine--tRNA ligase [Patescibacteria group bacterium]MBU4015016.1 histidine--tRNA ligase [Patescibacteria group bacterium]MBU4026448.1 histidine--tRNA ligase [Patescibacteria group bacterium]MBU4072591.1 histidine--tRNA ligase [Patescibacteria group bacterium]
MPKINFKKKNIKKDGQMKDNGKRKRRFARLRGMRDVLPDEYKYWNLVLCKAAKLAETYSFNRIDIPVLEQMDLYERSSGKTSDIVTKEMFSFVDKSGDRIALRPEATPGMVRSYIEHGMFNLPQPVKLFLLGPLFRHEKPQSGRYRQHNQFDLEIFGESNPAADAQLILIAYNFFRELQIEVQIQINSIGCEECREEYCRQLVEFYKERGKRAKLCNDCKKRLAKNPLRLLDCKEAPCIELKEEAPQIVDSLCDNCRNHFIKVLEYLDELDVAYNLDPHLVRGLDYYNKTVFEIFPLNSEDQGRQISLGGGGRYDGLVEQMGGRPTPACGFGIGIERAVSQVKEKNIPIKENNKADIFLAQLGEQARQKAMVLFEELRRAGFQIREAFTKDSLRSQLEIANRMGVKFSLILGQKEIMDKTILIRDMESGIQEVVDCKKLILEIEKRLNNGK